jgi:hypothetical protein
MSSIILFSPQSFAAKPIHRTENGGATDLHAEHPMPIVEKNAFSVLHSLVYRHGRSDLEPLNRQMEIHMYAF